MNGLNSIIQNFSPAVQFGWGGRLFLFFLLVGVPFLALLQPDDRELELPPRRALYISAIAGVLVLGAFTALVLWAESVPLSEVGLHRTNVAAFLGWTAAATVGALLANFLISRGAARLGIRESRLTYHLMPRTGEDRRFFFGVSAAAGFCEELAYHGFLLAGLAAWLENGWLAALVANLAFGTLHAYQGQAGAVRAFLMGYLLCVPVVVGVGLWPAVVAHFLVNLLLGFGLWKWMIPEPVADGR